MKFSILITTRTRVNFLNNLLQSIYRTTVDKENVEILVVYDNDDVQTAEFVRNFTAGIPPIKTVFYTRDRSSDLVNHYHNWLVKFALGKYILFVNDDALFETEVWDNMCWEELVKYEKNIPDGIVYGITEDYEHESKRNPSNWMACFPLICKKAIDILGYAFDPEFKRDGADWAIAATYRNLNRIINLRHCFTIRHLSFRSGRRAWDSLDEYSKQLGIGPPSPYAYVERDCKILLKYINLVKEQKLNPNDPVSKETLMAFDIPLDPNDKQSGVV